MEDLRAGLDLTPSDVMAAHANSRIKQADAESLARRMRQDAPALPVVSLSTYVSQPPVLRIVK